MQKISALLIFICLACNNRQANKAEPQGLPSVESDSVVTIVNQNANQVMAEPKQVNYESLELAIEIDDTVKLRHSTLIFQKSNSTRFNPYYSDYSIRKQLTSNEDNSHRRAQVIERYLSSDENFGKYFHSNDSLLVLRLMNDSTVVLPKWDYLNDYGYNFEHFFEDRGLFLIRIQYSEGNSWMLVDSRTGRATHLAGRPYFSPSNSYFVTIETDLDAGYNMNGIEFFKYSTDSISKYWQLNILNWGPSNIKWQNDSVLIVERIFWFPSDEVEYATDYATLTISNTGSNNP